MSNLGFPGGTSDKESICNAGDIRDEGLITRSGRSPGGTNGNLLQYFCLAGYGPWGRIDEVAQLRLTLCDPMDCSLPGSSNHGIFQARVLEWVAISFSRGSSQPRDRTQVSKIACRRFSIWAPGKPQSIRQNRVRHNWSDLALTHACMHV